MLDNLKLGYGGTKEEMQRLLEDAEKLSGVKYDISSYSDIVDAIHVVQTEMGITGTTAKEAEATISGSIGMLKSSFQNLITGLGDADADIDKLCDNVVNSFNSVVKNITPVVRNLAKTVPNALEGILDAIAPLLPELLEMGVGLFEALLSGFTSVLPELMNTAASLVTTLVQGIIEALPLVVEAAAQFITTLVQGIAEALPTLIPAAVETVTTIVSTLIENIPLLIDAALQLMQGLAEGVLEAIPVLLEALPELIESLVTTLLDAIPVSYTHLECDGVEYKEIIDRHAFDECDMSDVIFNYNHGGKVVARLRNKTLALNIDERGVNIDADLGGTTAGRELYEEIDGGYVDKMSFSFTVREASYDSVTHTRTITKVKKLYDVSAVDIPAYNDTSISARSFFEEEHSRELAALEQARRRKKLVALTY